MTIKNLLADATLRVALKPPHNWSDIGEVGPLTVPLIAEDYPAKTAVMWNEAYKRFGLPDRNSMMLADPKDAESIMRAFRTDPRYRGGGAGIGFKEVVVPLLDAVTPLARAMGAVNIIKKMPDGTLHGDNTDGPGFADSLDSMLSGLSKNIAGARVLILGAGGTGRAIGFALAMRGAQLTILNRTASKAIDLARAINVYLDNQVAVGGGRELIDKFLPTQDAVVSTVDDSHSPLDEYSPLGDMPTPVTPESLQENLRQSLVLLKQVKRDLIVSDIRIRNKETPMLAQARAHKLLVLNGLPMVTNQAVMAFWWLYGDVFEAKSLSKDDVADVMWQVM